MDADVGSHANNWPKLLGVLPEPVKALAITVAMTGPRIGEVFALRWRNLDFERSVIHVHESIYREEPLFAQVREQYSRYLVGTVASTAGI